MTSIERIFSNTVDDPKKSLHGVFTVAREKILLLNDQAFKVIKDKESARVFSVQGFEMTPLCSTYLVRFDEGIGYVGGVIGQLTQHPKADYLLMTFRNGNELLDAFPMNISVFKFCYPTIVVNKT